MLDQLKEILKKNHFFCEGVTENTELIAGLGLSSFQIIMLSADIEESFDIEIPDRAIKDLKTIGDVITLIQNLQ